MFVRRISAFTRLSAAALVLGATLAGCGNNDDDQASADGTATDKPLSMTIGTQALTVQTYFPQLAEALGYFDDENLDVEVIIGESTAASTQALLGGSMDAYFGGPEPLAANEQGASVRFVAAASEGSLWNLVTTKDIKSVKDLAGKTVAVSAVQSISALTVREALLANGVDPKTVKFLAAGGTGKRFAAIQAGQAAASPLGIPVNYQAVETGKFNDLGNFNDLGTPLFTGVIVSVTDEWAKAHKEEMNRFLRAYQRTVDAMYDPDMTDEITKIISAGIKVDEKYVRRAIEEIYLAGHPTATPKDLQIDVEALQRAADSFVEFGALKKKADASESVDMSYVEAAQDSLREDPPSER